MTETTPAPGTCTGTANYATGERCGSTEIAGFVLHVVSRSVAGVLDGSHPHPELHLQPYCAEHLTRAEESNRNLREHGPSQLIVHAGFVGSAVGTLWIIQPPQDDPS
ncbi:MAG: hypothetical protein ACXVGF_04670 [Blastococcus sp.]